MTRRVIPTKKAKNGKTGKITINLVVAIIVGDVSRTELVLAGYALSKYYHFANTHILFCNSVIKKSLNQPNTLCSPRSIVQELTYN